jgi:putative tryptophan/tyrosine transport system substrate-binding protein
MLHMSNRREFITLLGGATAAWTHAARAQQPERMRRIGVFSGGSASDPEVRPRIAAFVQGLALLGWTDGRNVRIDYRWGEGNTDTIRKAAVELVALAPDVILTPGGPALDWLLQATGTVPIVFVIAPDPVGSGFVESLARPGGNATGFMQFEYNLCAKWPELLKEIAPGVTRAAVLRDLLHPMGSANLPSSNPSRRRSAWRSSPSTCARNLNLSAPFRRSRASAIAA